MPKKTFDFNISVIHNAKSVVSNISSKSKLYRSVSNTFGDIMNYKMNDIPFDAKYMYGIFLNEYIDVSYTTKVNLDISFSKSTIIINFIIG